MDSFTHTDETLFRIDAAITQNGFYPSAVLDDPSWLYTVGLLKTWSHPELIVFGLGPQNAYGGISAVVDEIRSGVVHPVGRDKPFDIQGVASCFIPVLEDYWKYPCDYLLGASHYYGATGAPYDPRALQLVWADEEGRFPWDESFDGEPAGRQPLLDSPGGFSEAPWTDRCTWL